MRANKFGAACADPECATYVQPGEGVLIRRDGEQGWLVYCTRHAPGHERNEAGPTSSPMLWGSGREFPVPRNPEGRPHDELAAFLHARLEDEAGTAGAAWLTHWVHPSEQSWVIVDAHGEQVAQFNERDTARHAANWGPLTVLDHVDTRRLIIDAYEDAPKGSAQRKALRKVLCLLTWPYADYPDWQPAWGPQSFSLL